MLKIQFAKRYPWDLHKAVILKLYAAPKLFLFSGLLHTLLHFGGFFIYLSVYMVFLKANALEQGWADTFPHIFINVYFI